MDNTEFDIHQLLEEYKKYSQLFMRTVSHMEVWSEQTGCDADGFSEYLSCCEKRLFDFGTWFEHSYGHPYPDEPAFTSNARFKYDVCTFRL